MIANYVEPVTQWINKWGGVAQGVITRNIPAGMFADSLNYYVDSTGGISPRLGWDLVTDENPPDDGEIRTVFLADLDGDYRILVATDDHVYEFDETGTPSMYTELFEVADDPGLRFTFAVQNASSGAVVTWGNGVDDLQTWDGSSVVAVEGVVGRVANYKNYLALWDIPNDPGKVQFSALGDPTTWPSGRYLEMQGKVTSVFAYGGLVVFTATRTEVFLGDPDAPDSMQVLSASIGCAVHETVADCDGLLVWLSQAGVMTWDGGGRFPAANLSDPSDKAESVSRIQRDLDRLVWDEAEYISGCFDPANKRYLLSAQMTATAAGTPFWRTFALDMDRRAWFPWDLAATAMGVVIGSDNRQYVMGASLEGGLRKESLGQLYDEDLSGNTDVAYWATLGDLDAGAPDNEKTLRYISVGTTGSVGAGLVGTRTLKVRVRGEFGRTAATDVSIDASAGGFILDLGVLGDALSDTQRYLSYGAPTNMRAKFFTLTFFGSGNDNAAAISELGLEFMPGPRRRLMVGA
jgi:hypothetical protein